MLTKPAGPRGSKQKGWLWAFCCATAAFFMVHANCSQQAACKLIGGFSGKLVSDRYNAYNFYKLIRQICWAHLKRDFKAISEACNCHLSGIPAPSLMKPEGDLANSA